MRVGVVVAMGEVLGVGVTGLDETMGVFIITGEVLCVVKGWMRLWV